MIFNPIYNPFTLQDKTILITGASSGIGKATAIECSKLGATCIITGRDEDRLNDTLMCMVEGKHQIIVADISTQDGIDVVVANAPNIDGLVNNAGITRTKPISFITKDDIDDIFDINLFSHMLLTKQLYRKKKLNKNASIVFLSSMAALQPEIGNSIYAATKAALKTFMLSCAKEFAPKLIRSNSIHPGMVTTPLTENLNFDEETLELDKSHYLLKRYGKPEEIAYAIIYLLSDASSWVTGASIVIDGGRTI